MAERNRLRVAAHSCAAGRPRTNLSQEVVLLSGPHALPRDVGRGYRANMVNATQPTSVWAIRLSARLRVRGRSTS